MRKGEIIPLGKSRPHRRAKWRIRRGRDARLFGLTLAPTPQRALAAGGLAACAAIMALAIIALLPTLITVAAAVATFWIALAGAIWCARQLVERENQ